MYFNYFFFYKNTFSDQLNSNFWPVFRDDKFGFRISYPKNWSFPTIKGKNVKFSISPKNGAGNCNVVAKQKIEAESLTQTQLNQSINEIKNNDLDWSRFMGIPVSNINLIESHKAKILNISNTEILNISALFATTEVTLDDLNGTYFRKQITAVTITPGYAWTINCGASTYNIDETRKKFNELRPIFNNIFTSFTITR
jgi:hypothetical protein